MARREPRWVGPFLRLLERSGNVRMAAEGAGIDYTSAYQRRKRHGEFAERWEGCLETFKERGIPSPGSPAASPSSPLKGEELVVHPDGKVIRAGPGRWTRRAEVAFLTELAVGANVRRAAEAAGFSTVAVYKRRLKDPHFTEAWDAAIEAGKAKLEAMLVEAAQRRFDPDTLPISDQEPQVSVGEAINIVKLKRAEPGRGPANGGGRAPTVASDAEVREELAKRLRAFGVRVTQAMERGERELCPKCGAELGPPWG